MSRSPKVLLIASALAHTVSWAAPLPILDEPNEFNFTVSMLKKHFGDRLKESDYLCTLPPKAALRPPASWDCRTWKVERVRWGQTIFMDSASYQAMPDGRVIARTYAIDGDCSRALSAFFTLQSYGFRGTDGIAKGGQITTEQVLGSISMDKTFSGKEPEQGSAVINFESGKCGFLFWTEPKR